MYETCNLPTASLRAPNRPPSFHPQPPRTPRDDANLTVSRMLQNAAKCDKMQQKLVPARPRARARGKSFRFPSLDTDCPQADSTYRLQSPPPSRHANRSNRTPKRPYLTSPPNQPEPSQRWVVLTIQAAACDSPMLRQTLDRAMIHARPASKNADAWKLRANCSKRGMKSVQDMIYCLDFIRNNRPRFGQRPRPDARMAKAGLDRSNRW